MKEQKENFINKETDETSILDDNESMKAFDRNDQQSWQGESKTYMVQVSTKLANKQVDESQDTMFELVATSCRIFINSWQRKGLIQGVLHDATKEIITDFIDYDS